MEQIHYSSCWRVRRFLNGGPGSPRVDRGRRSEHGRGISTQTWSRFCCYKTPLRIYYPHLLHIYGDSLMTWAMCWCKLMTLEGTAQQFYKKTNNKGLKDSSSVVSPGQHSCLLIVFFWKNLTLPYCSLSKALDDEYVMSAFISIIQT